jgi:hypothetical protein
MIPYQEASRAKAEKNKRDEEFIRKLGKTGLEVGLTALGATAGSSMITKALPFLSKGINPKNAIAGLTAISPKFGKFINDSLKGGETFDKIREFISDKLMKAEQSKPQSLFERLTGGIDISSLNDKAQEKLRFYIPVAAQMEKEGKDERDISVRNLKKKIDKILNNAIGKAGKLGDEFLMGEKIQGTPEMQEYLRRAVPREQMQAQEPMPQQQVGQGQQALMEILQKIQATRGQSG